MGWQSFPRATPARSWRPFGESVGILLMVDLMYFVAATSWCLHGVPLYSIGQEHFPSCKSTIQWLCGSVWLQTMYTSGSSSMAVTSSKVVLPSFTPAKVHFNDTK